MGCSAQKLIHFAQTDADADAVVALVVAAAAVTPHFQQRLVRQQLSETGWCFQPRRV